MHTNELPKLEDIIEKLEPEIDENYEDNKYDIIESVNIFIDDILSENPRIYEEYNFDDILYDSIHKVFMDAYGDEITIFEDYDISELINDAIDIYFSTHNPRSYSGTFYPINSDYDALEKHLKKNMKKEQPEQKTEAWYKFRHSMLTASSIWKCLSSTGIKNGLIYSKCQPSDKNSKRGVNINSAMHWGHKYEPLSTLIYEEEHNTEIAEVGCVRHDTISFIGASPDGINVKRDNPLFGRALEIKNPVSRELTGTPKLDYWIQMQIQMEVWNFEEVDFLETVFKEYDCEEDFIKDGTYNKTKSGKQKGVIVAFLGTKPIYEYMPFNLTQEEGEKWIDDKIDEYTSKYTWVQNIYWYLDDVSCVLVPMYPFALLVSLPLFLV